MTGWAAWAQDKAAARKLWTLSETMLGQSFDLQMSSDL